MFSSFGLDVHFRFNGFFSPLGIGAKLISDTLRLLTGQTTDGEAGLRLALVFATLLDDGLRLKQGHESFGVIRKGFSDWIVHGFRCWGLRVACL